MCMSVHLISICLAFKLFTFLNILISSGQAWNDTSAKELVVKWEWLCKINLQNYLDILSYFPVMKAWLLMKMYNLVLSQIKRNGHLCAAVWHSNLFYDQLIFLNRKFNLIFQWITPNMGNVGTLSRCISTYILAQFDADPNLDFCALPVVCMPLSAISLCLWAWWPKKSLWNFIDTCDMGQGRTHNILPAVIFLQEQVLLF